MACYIGHSSSSAVSVLVLALVVSSLGGNFPAIRAHSPRLFLQAPSFLSQSVSQGEAFRRRHSYSPFVVALFFYPLTCSTTEHLTSPAWSVFSPEFHAGGDKSV